MNGEELNINMNNKEMHKRFILADEPGRIKKEYNTKDSILNIHQSFSDSKPILNDGKPKQKVITKYYKRG